MKQLYTNNYVMYSVLKGKTSIGCTGLDGRGGAICAGMLMKGANVGHVCGGQPGRMGQFQ